MTHVCPLTLTNYYLTNSQQKNVYEKLINLYLVKTKYGSSIKRFFIHLNFLPGSLSGL